MLDNDAYSSPTPTAGKGTTAERALRSAIVHGVLKPGERLSEAALCGEFAIGRGAVRAALARLQASGFVSAAPRSGWQVAPVSAAEIREVVIARRRLEPLLARVPLGEGDRAQLLRLADMYGAIASRPEQSSELLATLRRTERDLLALLAARLNMPTLTGWLTDLWDRSARLVFFFEARSPSRLKAPNRPLLAERLVEGDLDAAEALLSGAVDELEAYLAARFLESEATLGEPTTRRPALPDKSGKSTQKQRNLDRTRTI